MSKQESRQDKILLEYEQMAQGYDAGSAACGWAAPEVLVKALGDRGLIGPGMEVVDFAVGTGALTSAFRRFGEAGKALHITATDLSPSMLEKCRRKGVADTLLRQDITKPWPFPMSSKDIVAATGVAEYLTDGELASVVAAAGQTLRAGGVLAFTFLPAAEGVSPSRPEEQQQHTISYVQGLFSSNGMAVRDMRTFDAYRASDGNTVRHVLVLGMKT